MAQITGVRTFTSGEILSARKIVDMADEIVTYDPSAAPLTVMTSKLDSKETKNYRFDWLEDDLPAKWAYFSSGETGSTDTTFVVDDGTKFTQGTVFRNVVTGEQFRTESISTNTLTVSTRPFGETTNAVQTANDPLLIYGTAGASGRTYPDARSTIETSQYNLTQLFYTPVEIGNREQAMQLYGGNDRRVQQKQLGIAHLRDIETAFWVGEREEQNTDDSPVKVATSTRGVLKWITTNVDSVPTLDQTTWEDFLAKSYQYDRTSRRVVFASGVIQKAVSFWARGRLQTFANDKTFGIQISEYISAYGPVSIIAADRILENSPVGDTTKGYGGYAVALNMKYLGKRYLPGWNATLAEDVKDDFHGTKDLWISDCGLMFRLEKMHAVLKDVGGYV